MSGEIRDLSSTEAPDSVTVEICIVGSGCGGATSARLLAEAGREVLVLEEGPDLTGPQLTQVGAEMYDQLYMERGGRSTDDLAIQVLQGRALGGGGVVNVCDVVPIPEGVLRHWQRAFGLGAFSPEALAPHAAAALEDLSAAPIPDALVNRANRLLARGAESLGWRGEVMWSNRAGCLGLGTCLIGCPAGAKRNPRMVAIPRAIEAGARFWTRARVTRIDDAGSELKTLTVRCLDPRGYHEREVLRVRARVVILAANAIGSSQLLLRSGIGNEHVGRHLTLQPQLPIVAEFADDVRAFLGVPQAYAVTEFEEEAHPEHGLWGFRIEAVMGVPGVVSSLLPESGAPGMELMRRYSKMAAALLLIPDRPSGRVELWSDGRPRIRYEHAGDHLSRARAAVRAAARAYLAAGAVRVMVPLVPPFVMESERDLDGVETLRFLPATTPWLSAHQQGTVRFSTSEAEGGANPDGLVWGSRDIYVFDTSGFPSSASSHTMAPTITISRHLTESLLAGLP